MNEFLTAMSLVIRSQRGTLDKYVGDQIMAFWARRSRIPSTRARR
jgi:adenylate cyclase